MAWNPPIAWINTIDLGEARLNVDEVQRCDVTVAHRVLLWRSNGVLARRELMMRCYWLANLEKPAPIKNVPYLPNLQIDLRT
jgi:hypothetical protein